MIKKIKFKKRLQIKTTIDLRVLRVQKRLAKYIKRTRNWALKKKGFKPKLYSKVLQFFGKRKFGFNDIKNFRQTRLHARKLFLRIGNAFRLFYKPIKVGTKRRRRLKAKSAYIAKSYIKKYKIIMKKISLQQHNENKILLLQLTRQEFSTLNINNNNQLLLKRISNILNPKIKDKPFEEKTTASEFFLETEKISARFEENKEIIASSKKIKYYNTQDMMSSELAMNLYYGLYGLKPLILDLEKQKLQKAIEMIASIKKLEWHFYRSVSKHWPEWGLNKMLKKAWFVRLTKQHSILKQFILGTIFFMKYRRNTFVALFENDIHGPIKLKFKASLGCTRGTLLGGATYRGTKKKSEEGPLDVATYTANVLYKMGHTWYDIIFVKTPSWIISRVYRRLTPMKYFIRLFGVKRCIGYGLPRPQKKARK